MVYTGRPSGGCAVCRKRRIKCDEKAPACSYCIKTQQLCPGYKSQFDLAWRNQNTVAQKSVERRKKETGAQIVLRSTTRSAWASDKASSHSTMAEPYLSQNIDEVPEDHYLTFFFSTYANPPATTDETRGFLDYLYPLYSTATSRSVLQLSTLAVSAYLFTAWQNHSPNVSISRSFYHQAVHTIKALITSEYACGDDELLMSVLLLQMYDKLDSKGKAKSPRPRAHLIGALGLIKHRGLDTFDSEVSQGLLLSVRNQLIQEAFKTSNPCDEEVEWWGWHCRGLKQPPTFLLDNINVSIAALQASIDEQKLSPTSENVDSALLETAYALEQSLLDWAIVLPKSWNYASVKASYIPSSVRRAGLYQSNCSVYSHISAASGWNKYRVSMIKLHKMILRLSPNDSNSLAHSTTMIQILADEICASIPFILGDRVEPGSIGDENVQYPYLEGESVPKSHYWMAPAVGGFNLVDGFGGAQSLSPLGEVLCTEGLRDGQREWIGSQLRRIAKIHNLGR